MFIVSAPSGTGKTTLIHRLMRAAPVRGLSFSVSHTTRRPRGAERDGHDYHFVDEGTFDRMVDDGRFLEWAEVHNNRYGTSRDEVFPRLERGEDVMLEIDVQGAARVKASCPEAHAIFVMPPSFEVLRRRIIGRGLEPREETERRLAISISEISRFKEYDYVIVNDDLGRASRSLAAIILEKRHRLRRIEERAEQILADFHTAGPASR